MNITGNFQILKVLNPRTKSDALLVEQTTSKELFVWRTILLKNISKEQREVLCNKVRNRIQQKHPLLVKFYSVIEDDEKKTLYIPMEYFCLGNISDFLKKLKKSNVTHINEEVIVKVLFQLLILLKSTDIDNYINSKTLYFDEYFNVKAMNFSMWDSPKNDIKMCEIGTLAIQLCTLNTKKLCDKYIVNSDYYSAQFIDLTEIMLNDTKNVKINADKILCHPVILMNTFKLNCGIKLNGCLEILDYRTKLENIRKKEAILKTKEKKIENLEHTLKLREKKIIICEKEIKSKLTQAELYLKRSKKSNNKYEVDNSAEDEELDSEIVETSKKINIEKLEKSTFTRTFSERRVKFKGHSPLKEMDFHKGKSVRKSKANLGLFKDQFTESKKLEDEKIETKKLRDISNVEMPSLMIKDSKKRTSIFSTKIQVQDENSQNMDCLPIAWSEENKKQAFDMLRIMNSTASNNPQVSTVKHTYL